VTPLLLRNALCASLSPVALAAADLRITDGTIVNMAPTLPAEPGDSVKDLGGALILPGGVCAHTHLYSSLSRGMPGPGEEPRDFPAMLDAVWWKLDKSLNEETIYYSALAGGMEAVRCGVTTIVDHHASPNIIPGSLSIIENALHAIGVRGILCYETSDRDGPLRRDQGVMENEDFIARHRTHDMVRGVVGAHASFTLSDETLSALAEVVDRHDSGLHIHVAEDVADVELTRRDHGRGILERLRSHGLVRPRSIFAHGVHLNEQEYAGLRDAGTWLVHNPRSNMNNAVGHAPLNLFGARAALGTDGFPADMYEEARCAWLRNRETRPHVPPGIILHMLAAGGTLASEVFGRPIGALHQGAAADLVVLDYCPPTPLTPENLPFHVLFGLRSAMVRSVMINGNWVLRDRTFCHLQEQEILKDAAAAAAHLWRTMHG
jgi:putative selenium metabolism protein SsnA